MVNYITSIMAEVCQTIFIEKEQKFCYQPNMSEERKSYNTTLRADLMKNLRILAAQLEKRQNDLLEEAIQDLLNKYKKKTKISLDQK